MSSSDCGTRSTPSRETTVVVDVERLTVEVPSIGLDTPFALDSATQRRFLDGLDDIGITLGYEADIARYETSERTAASLDRKRSPGRDLGTIRRGCGRGR